MQEIDSAVWVLGGSAGLLLRGISLSAPPRDIDLYCDEKDIYVIHQKLLRYAIDTPQLSETAIYKSTLSHYWIGELMVELVGGFQVSAFGCRYSADVRDILHPYGEDIGVYGSTDMPCKVRVAPLAHELWFNALREREDRFTLIAEAMRKEPQSHKEVLAVIEANNRFRSEMIANVHLRMCNRKEVGRQ